MLNTPVPARPRIASFTGRVKASHWLAYWDVFGRPATKPRYARGIPETWWYDHEKAATIDQ